MTEKQRQCRILQANEARRVEGEQGCQATEECTIAAKLAPPGFDYHAPPRRQSSDNADAKRYSVYCSMAPKSSPHPSNVWVKIEAKAYHTLYWLRDQAAGFFDIDCKKYYPVIEAQCHDLKGTMGETFTKEVLNLVFRRGGRGGARPAGSSSGASSSDAEETYSAPVEDDAAATTKTEASSWSASLTASTTTDDAAPLATAGEPGSSSGVTPTDDRLELCIVPRCRHPRSQVVLSNGITLQHEFCSITCAKVWKEYVQLSLIHI